MAKDELDSSLDAVRSGEFGAKPKKKGVSVAVSVPAPQPPRPAGIGGLAKAIVASAKPIEAASVVADDESVGDPAFRFAFLGAGQGGGKIAQAFYQLGYRRVAAYNTTENDFEGLDPAIAKYSTKTHGAAKDMAVARTAIRGRDEDIRSLLAKSWGPEVDYAMVCASLGGGTGSGSALPLVEMARKYVGAGGKVGAIVSLPKQNEGRQIARNAVLAFKELLAAKLTPLIVIDNDRVKQLYNVPMTKFFPTANGVVAQMLHAFNSLANTRSAFATFDRAEFAHVLDGGLMTMGVANIDMAGAERPDDVATMIRDQFTAGILADMDWGKARRGACVFIADEGVLDNVSSEYFDAGFTQLDRMLGKDLPDGAQIVTHRGLYMGSDPGVQCFTAVSELSPPDGKMLALAQEAQFDKPQLPQPAAASHFKL